MYYIPDAGNGQNYPLNPCFLWNQQSNYSGAAYRYSIQVGNTSYSVDIYGRTWFRIPISAGLVPGGFYAVVVTSYFPDGSSSQPAVWTYFTTASVATYDLSGACAPTAGYDPIYVGNAQVYYYWNEPFPTPDAYEIQILYPGTTTWTMYNNNYPPGNSSTTGLYIPLSGGGGVYLFRIRARLGPLYNCAYSAWSSASYYIYSVVSVSSAWSVRTVPSLPTCKITLKTIASTCKASASRFITRAIGAFTHPVAVRVTQPKRNIAFSRYFVANITQTIARGFRSLRSFAVRAMVIGGKSMYQSTEFAVKVASSFLMNRIYLFFYFAKATASTSIKQFVKRLFSVTMKAQRIRYLTLDPFLYHVSTGLEFLSNKFKTGRFVICNFFVRANVKEAEDVWNIGWHDRFRTNNYTITFYKTQFDAFNQTNGVVYKDNYAPWSISIPRNWKGFAFSPFNDCEDVWVSVSAVGRSPLLVKKIRR